MSDFSLDTLRLHNCVGRWQSGDEAAADELLRALGARLEHLARKMLRSFPNVRRWAETGDVLQGSLIRLLHTLRTVRPESTKHFSNLAAVHLRRELLDLARHFGARRYAVAESLDDEGAVPAAPTGGDDLELWCRFHEAVDCLPVEEREVVGLAFYHGWTQAQIAELFAIDERTVRRRWQSACLRLHELVGGELPSGQ